MKYIIALMLFISAPVGAEELYIYKDYMSCDDLSHFSQCGQAVHKKYCEKLKKLPIRVQENISSNLECDNLQADLDGNTSHKAAINKQIKDKHCELNDFDTVQRVRDNWEQPEIARQPLFFVEDLNKELRACSVQESR